MASFYGEINYQLEASIRSRNPQKEVLQSLIKSGYKISFVPHKGVWSAHIAPAQLKIVDSDQVYGGTAETQTLALAKALSEYVERNALGEIASLDPLVFDSSGFAARPLSGLIPLEKWKTQSAARFEALERYFGYHWWEDESVGHTVSILDEKKFISFEQLDLVGKFAKIVLVQVQTRGLEDVLVLIGMFPEKGFTLGCAAGWAWERPKTFFRASVELMRHFQIVHRRQLAKIPSNSPYDLKLMHLASGEVDISLQNRLSLIGKKSLSRPKVAFDGPVKHQYSDLYYVYRCVFEGQPDILARINNIII